MNARAKQLDAEQGADEERKEDVQNSTSIEHRNQQRSNASRSTGGAASSAGEAVDSTVHSSVNQYEIAVLYHPDLEIDLEKATGKIEKIIADNKGKVVKTDSWGKRKLAYPIVKQDFAVYVFYTVDIPAENVAKIEQIFNITDEIIRFLITKPDLKAMAKAEVLKAEKLKKAAERTDRDGERDEEAPKPRRGSTIVE